MKDFETETENDITEVEIDITEEDFLRIASMAHKKDIKFNQMCNTILSDYVDNIEKNSPIKS